jgi:hypothetical protein
MKQGRMTAPPLSGTPEGTARAVGFLGRTLDFGTH